MTHSAEIFHATPELLVLQHTPEHCDSPRGRQAPGTIHLPRGQVGKVAPAQLYPSWAQTKTAAGKRRTKDKLQMHYAKKLQLAHLTASQTSASCSSHPLVRSACRVTNILSHIDSSQGRHSVFFPQLAPFCSDHLFQHRADVCHGAEAKSTHIVTFKRKEKKNQCGHNLNVTAFDYHDLQKTSCPSRSCKLHRTAVKCKIFLPLLKEIYLYKNVY